MATKEERLRKQIERLAEMKRTEDEVRRQGIRFVAGVDEVGRGPLAGPVVTAAVVLPGDFDVPGIDDSKKLSEKKREELYDVIMEKALAVGIGQADWHQIDEMNILQATKLAMREAIDHARENLRRRTGEERAQIGRVLIDAVTLEGLDIPQRSIVRGDAKVLCIAAASIVAKVTRDRMMTAWSKVYPYYAFERNKGYGTKAHYEGLRAHGPCPIHRKTFLRNMH